MKYTEDYRRLVGIRGQGRLIGGLEGYQGRNLVSGVNEDVLDQLALGFGGFEDLGAAETHTYIFKLKTPDGKVTELKRLNIAYADAVGYFNQLASTYTPDHTLYLTVWMDYGAYTNNPKEVPVSTRAGSKQVVMPPPPVGKIRYAFRVNGKVVKEGDYSAEDVAYADWLSLCNQRTTEDTVDFMKLSTGEIVASGTGKNIKEASIPFKVIIVGPNGARDASGGVAKESALPSTVAKMVDEAAQNAYTDELVMGGRTDTGEEYARKPGIKVRPPPPKPPVTEPPVTPDLGPTEPTPSTTTTTGVTGSMASGYEKFKTFMTDQAIKPVPNGVWVGIGIAVVVGVGIAASTMKK